jgi:hypothetical protein
MLSIVYACYPEIALITWIASLAQNIASVSAPTDFRRRVCTAAGSGRSTSDTVPCKLEGTPSGLRMLAQQRPFCVTGVWNKLYRSVWHP